MEMPQNFQHTIDKALQWKCSQVTGISSKSLLWQQVWSNRLLLKQKTEKSDGCVTKSLGDELCGVFFVGRQQVEVNSTCLYKAVSDTATMSCFVKMLRFGAVKKALTLVRKILTQHEWVWFLFSFEYAETVPRPYLLSVSQNQMQFLFVAFRCPWQMAVRVESICWR